MSCHFPQGTVGVGALISCHVLPTLLLMHVHVYLDPRLWSKWEVNHWLDWCQAEFGLCCLGSDLRGLDGSELCGLDQEAFLGLLSDSTAGEILWEHLETMRRGDSTFIEKHRVSFLATLFSIIAQEWWRIQNSEILNGQFSLHSPFSHQVIIWHFRQCWIDVLSHILPPVYVWTMKKIRTASNLILLLSSVKKKKYWYMEQSELYA